MTARQTASGDGGILSGGDVRCDSSTKHPGGENPAGYANDHFADHGIQADEPTLFRGWSDLAEAFLSDQVNVAHFFMPMTLWMRYGDELSADVNVVAWDHTDGSALTVQPDIDDWADLGGGEVAVPFWYWIHNVVLQMGLRQHGLTPRTNASREELADDEVNLVVTPPPDMPAALGTGSIEGYIIAEPFNAIGELEANGKILRFTGDIWKQHVCCVITMKEQLVNEQPEWAADVVSGIVDAQQWLRGHRSDAATLLSTDDTGLYPQGAEPIDCALTLYDNHDQYVDSEAIQNTDWENNRIGFYPYPYPSYTEGPVGCATRASRVTRDFSRRSPRSLSQTISSHTTRSKRQLNEPVVHRRLTSRITMATTDRRRYSSEIGEEAGKLLPLWDSAPDSSSGIS